MADVASAYDKDPEREWERLTRDAYHALEFDRTMEVIEQFIEPGTVLLDVGGGPGRYAIALCRRGYRVALCDLSPGNVALFEEYMADEPGEVRAQLLAARVADVRELPSLPGEPFDGVLCLGPLTHLPCEDDRRHALLQLWTKLRPGGVLLLSVGGYLALLRTIARLGGDDLIDDQLWDWLSVGDARVGGMRWHFFRALEIRQLAEAAGFETMDMVACQSLATGMIDETNGLASAGARFERWRELLWRFAREPGVVDMAEHIIYVGFKPG